MVGFPHNTVLARSADIEGSSLPPAHAVDPIAATKEDCGVAMNILFGQFLNDSDLTIADVEQKYVAACNANPIYYFDDRIPEGHVLGKEKAKNVFHVMVESNDNSKVVIFATEQTGSIDYRVFRHTFFDRIFPEVGLQIGQNFLTISLADLRISINRYAEDHNLKAEVAAAVKAAKEELTP